MSATNEATEIQTEITRLSSKVVPRRTRVYRHSRMFTLGPVDGRSTEGQYLGRVRQELLRHIGADPTPVQHALIERACRASLVLHRLDARMIAGEVLSDGELKTHSHLQVSLRQTLKALDKPSAKAGEPSKAAEPAKPSLAEYLARKDREREAAQ